MSFRTDRQRVQGLGSAREGTGHFWQQRLTAIALVPLFLLFVFPFSNALGTSHETTGADWFAPDAIPPLCPDRAALHYLDLAWRHHADPSLPTEFD